MDADEMLVPEWHRQLLEERLEDQRRNPNDSVSWEELKDELSGDEGALRRRGLLRPAGN
jgi:hypothetical protein